MWKTTDLLYCTPEHKLGPL